jgi:hypothetical protein
MPALKSIAKLAPVVVTVHAVLNGDNVDQNIFIADRPYRVLAVRESHATAGNDAGAVSLDVKKATGTTAIASGTTVLGSTFDLKGTANTVVTKTRDNGGVVATAVATLAEGDRLGLDVTGTITTLAGVCVSIVLQPTGVPSDN